MTLPRHWIVAMILATTIGPNLLVMSGFMQIQTIIQNAFGSSSYATMWISIVANMAFAVWIPLGPVLSRQLGLRFCFRCATVMFVVTFTASSISDNTVLLGISRALEGALTGTQLMVLVPLLFVEFPAERRNRVLGILLCIMFGSVVLGAIFGTISQAYDHWRWLFGLCACLSLGALLLSGHLPKHMFPVPSMASARGAWNRFDYIGTTLLLCSGHRRYGGLEICYRMDSAVRSYLCPRVYPFVYSRV